MTQTIYDALHGINPEIVTVGTLLETYDYTVGEGVENGDDDLFQCGKCKKQFYSFGAFMMHKRSHQLSNFTIGQTVVSDTSAETDLQLQPIILSESDILSFNISQTELSLSTPDEIAEEEPIEGLLLPVVSSESSQIFNLGQPITYLNKDHFIITANEFEEEDNGKDTQNEELLKEEQRKIKEAKLKCPYCLKQFTKYFDLQQHMRVHTGERPFQCIVCGRAFTQKSNIKKHMATHKSWPQRIKTLPEKPIKKISTSTAGETVVVDESFVCQYCPASFSSYVQLITHRKTHSNNKIFKCVQKNCHEVFETLDRFLEHTAAHQGSSNAEYRCFHCRQPFQSLDDLSNHQRLHMPCRKRKQKSMLCKLCKKKFFSVEALERHQGEDPHAYPCPECNKVYVSEGQLRRHISTHSSLLPATCTVCGKSFKTAQNLSVHKLVHSSERPFNCNFCSATFARHDRLIRHTFIHDPNRRYKCPFNKSMGCEMEFYRKDKLKQHILTHSTNKNLNCLRCNRNFKRSSQLRRHETICLSEDKPCEDCGHVNTSTGNCKKNTTVSKDPRHVNRRKYRLLESRRKEDDGVPTIQVVVVPLNGEASEQQDSGS